MTDFEKQEIRGITGRMIVTFVIGSLGVIGSVIGGCMYIASKFYEQTTKIAVHTVQLEQHEQRLVKLENR